MKKVVVVLEVESDAKCMRYPTLGDWYWKEGVLHIVCLDTKNKHYNFLLLFHELVEAYLCHKEKIGQTEVDVFDRLFERKRKLGLVTGEPGDAFSSPYHFQHKFSSKVESELASFMEIDFITYCDLMDRLFEKKFKSTK